MNEPTSLWPWPWWMALIAVASLVSAGGLGALLGVRLRAPLLERASRGLREAGLLPTEDALGIVGQKNSLVLSGERVAVVDMRDARVVQTLRLADVVALKTYEGTSEDIRFRLVTKNGAQTRVIATRSIVDFARVFGFVTRSGTDVEYIVE